MDILEAMHLIERVPSYEESEYRSIRKKDKIFFLDSGLMASVLDWRLEDVLQDTDQIGKLLETYVFQQLSSMVVAEKYDYHLMTYRDASREIDFLIRYKNKAYLGLEVKATSSVGPNDFRHLRWFRENLCRGKDFLGVVIYTGSEVLRFQGMWALPLYHLWI